MAKTRLTEYKCETAKPGRHGDGRNLYLQVRNDLNKSWIYRYRDAEGKDRFHGMGPWPLVSLEEARARAIELGRMRRDGRDPLAEAAAAKAKGDLGMTSITFRDALEKLIESKRAEWKASHKGKATGDGQQSGSEAQWRQSMEDYVLPTLGKLDVRLIQPQHVVTILRPIWSNKLETARRVRSRIEQVLGWAIAMELADAPNPARLKDNLANLLPKHKEIQKKDKTKRVRHHAALAPADMPAFMRDLRQMPGVSPRALEFLTLTTVRTANVLNATWGEFDLDNRLWLIDAEGMKADRDHASPLSDRAVDILSEMRATKGVKAGPADLVFPNVRSGEAMSENSLLAVLARMGLKGKATGHGMRASFGTWAQESSGKFSEDAIRVQLAHASGDDTRDAYLRGQLLDARRVLVQAWADFLASTPDAPAANVVPIQRGKGGA